MKISTEYQLGFVAGSNFNTKEFSMLMTKSAMRDRKLKSYNVTSTYHYMKKYYNMPTMKIPRHALILHLNLYTDLTFNQRISVRGFRLSDINAYINPLARRTAPNRTQRKHKLTVGYFVW